ncbi:MAG: hypothetical protein OZ921_21185, partial [Sorangiineae bacterium]|nr:hypothetical protein [Sorangiineae bacterium]
MAKPVRVRAAELRQRSHPNIFVGRLDVAAGVAARRPAPPGDALRRPATPPCDAAQRRRPAAP